MIYCLKKTQFKNVPPLISMFWFFIDINHSTKLRFDFNAFAEASYRANEQALDNPTKCFSDIGLKIRMLNVSGPDEFIIANIMFFHFRLKRELALWTF